MMYLANERGANWKSKQGVDRKVFRSNTNLNEMIFQIITQPKLIDYLIQTYKHPNIQAKYPYI